MNVTVANFPKLFGYINQYKLMTELDNFQLRNFGEFPEQNSEYSRIIITTVDVLQGLNLIIQYFLITNQNIRNLEENRDITAVNIANFYKTKVPNGFEIAWGLLDQLFKRKNKNEKIFVTTSFICAQNAIQNLLSNATLVLDGHGGPINCTFADRAKLMAIEILQELNTLLEKDPKHCIDHLILQSCNSGVLISESVVTMYFPKKTIGKSRNIALISQEVKVDEIFTKISGLDSLASKVFKSLLDCNRTDIAFTFSENLICPANIFGQGNLGLPKSTNGIKWPYNALDIEIANNKSKSTTLVFDAGHRKAGGAGAFFKTLEFSNASFTTLKSIRKSISMMSFSEEESSIATPATTVESCTSRASTFTPISNNFRFFTISSCAEEYINESPAIDIRENTITPIPANNVDYSSFVYTTPERNIKRPTTNSTKFSGINSPFADDYIHSLSTIYGNEIALDNDDLSNLEHELRI